MALTFDSLAVSAVCVLAGIALGGLGVLQAGRRKNLQRARDTTTISNTIIEYFRHSGVEVEVNCISLRGDRHFTVFIESEPMKRFRLSHIIEATLSEHVISTCNLEVEKIYWRFPIKEISVTYPKGEPVIVSQAEAPQETEGMALESEAKTFIDDYISEGIEHYKNLPQVEVIELSWESFQEASTMEAGKKSS